VVAHELAHVVTSDSSHSLSGVMTPMLHLADVDRHALRLSPEHAARIRLRLRDWHFADAAVDFPRDVCNRPARGYTGESQE
jgi:hypothetical protein